MKYSLFFLKDSKAGLVFTYSISIFLGVQSESNWNAKSTWCKQSSLLVVFKFTNQKTTTSHPSRGEEAVNEDGVEVEPGGGGHSVLQVLGGHLGRSPGGPSHRASYYPVQDHAPRALHRTDQRAHHGPHGQACPQPPGQGSPEPAVVHLRLRSDLRPGGGVARLPLPLQLVPAVPLPQLLARPLHLRRSLPLEPLLLLPHAGLRRLEGPAGEETPAAGRHHPLHLLQELPVPTAVSPVLVENVVASSELLHQLLQVPVALQQPVVQTASFQGALVGQQHHAVPQAVHPEALGHQLGHLDVIRGDLLQVERHKQGMGTGAGQALWPFQLHLPLGLRYILGVDVWTVDHRHSPSGQLSCALPASWHAEDILGELLPPQDGVGQLKLRWAVAADHHES